jgi:hypothetical protein
MTVRKSRANGAALLEGAVFEWCAGVDMLLGSDPLEGEDLEQLEVALAMVGGREQLTRQSNHVLITGLRSRQIG